MGDGFLPCPTEATCSPPTPSSRGELGALQHGYLSHSPPFWRPQNPEYEASHLVAQGTVVPRATNEHPPPPEPVVRIKSLTVLHLPSARGGGHLSTAPHRRQGEGGQCGRAKFDEGPPRRQSSALTLLSPHRGLRSYQAHQAQLVTDFTPSPWLCGGCGCSPVTVELERETAQLPAQSSDNCRRRLNY